MLLMVNKQVNSDSQQIWGLLRDGWADVFSCIPKVLYWTEHAHTHTHTYAHTLSHSAGGSAWVTLSRTCHHLTLHSHNQQACQLLSVDDSLAHTLCCVCMWLYVCKVSCLIYSPTPATKSYTTETPLSLSLPPLPPERQRRVCVCALCASLSRSPSLPWQREMRCRADNWSSCHTLPMEKMAPWSKAEETMRVRMRQRKTDRQLKMNRRRVELGESIPDKVTLLGRLHWAGSWSTADSAEAGVGVMSRALSIKPLTGCPAKNCCKRGYDFNIQPDHIALERGLPSKSIHLDRCLSCNEAVRADSLHVVYSKQVLLSLTPSGFSVPLKDTMTANKATDGRLIGVQELKPSLSQL